MRIREPQALGGQPVDMGRLNFRRRVVTRHIAITEIIGEDHHDVGLRRTKRRREARAQQPEETK
jgi:hypothetical protein